jgi:hypothetical protein
MIIGILIWKFYPREESLFPTSKKGYVVVRRKNPSYSPIKTQPVKKEPVVPKIETNQKTSQEKKKEETRKLVIEEIRKKALREDKKIKKLFRGY